MGLGIGPWKGVRVGHPIVTNWEFNAACCQITLRNLVSKETLKCGSCDLVDVFVSGPREAAEVVAAENVERRVVKARAGRKQHRHEQLCVDDVDSLAARRYPLRRVQQVQRSRVRSLADGLHERRATFRIPTTLSVTLARY